MGELNIYETESIINKELNVTYTPNSSVKGYTYEVLKDGERYGIYKISTNRKSEIILSESGNYQIIITNYLANNKTSNVESGIYKLDLDAPYIISEESKTVYQLKKGEKYTVDKSELNIRAYDKIEGDITSKMKCNFEDVDFSITGIQTLTCQVEDNAGNMISKNISINVIQNINNGISALQIIFFAILIFLALNIVRFRNSYNLEKRISKYSLEPLKDKKESIFEHFHAIYKQYITILSKILKKSVFITNYSKKYEKYIILYDKYYQNGIEIVSNKITIGLLFIILAIFSKMLNYQVIKLYECLIPFIFGFYLLDIIFISKYKIYRSNLENNLLQAITVMNNAFKSGRSITQAVELVSKQLEGPIALEFKKMYMELNLGLEIDVVFERFYKRVNLEEIAYLTASLSVLNKTGGNIIKVFSSIEENLFNKKKLKLELDSLTGTSKIIVYVLYLVPISFILFISLINPEYFEPFYTTGIGLIFMFIIVLLYVIYIFVVNKVMKVRM